MSSALIASLWRDCRAVFRHARGTPAVATAAVLALSVGLGINAAMVSVMDALWFRPPNHVADPASVSRLQFHFQMPSGLSVVNGTHYPTFADLARAGGFGRVAAYATTTASFGVGVSATPVSAMLVSREFFDVLRTPPHRGVLQVSADERLVVVSHGFWLRFLGGREISGNQTLAFDGQSFSIAGVTPQGFQSLSPRPVDVWLPLEHAEVTGFAPPNWRTDRGPYWLSVVARLVRDGAQHEAEVTATQALMTGRLAEDGDTTPVSVGLTSVVPGRGPEHSLDGRVALWLTAVSLCVLLMACANVVNLVLAKAHAAQRDTATRLSLGASRWDLARAALVDAAVLTAIGMAGAALLSVAARRSIAALFPSDIPLPIEWFDPRSLIILAFSSAWTFVALAVASVLSSGWRRSTMRVTSHVGVGVRRTRHALLFIQAGLGLVLVSGAGMFGLSLYRVQSLDLGVDLGRTVQITMMFLPQQRDPAIRTDTYDRTLATLAAHPDIERVAMAGSSPFMSGRGEAPWTDDRGHDELWKGNEEVAYVSAVGSGYFTAVGATLRGRDVLDSDRRGAEPVVIVNAPLARHLWPNEDALGRCLRIESEPRCVRVVGVLSGVWKFAALKRTRMALYRPLAQSLPSTPETLFARLKAPGPDSLSRLRAAVQAVSSDLPAARLTWLADAVTREFRPWRLGAWTLSTFAAVALVIAAVGLFSVVSVVTIERKTELAVRSALGCPRARIVTTAVGETLAWVAAGLAVGVVVVLASSRLIGDLLYATAPRDPGVLAGSVLLLVIVSLGAALGPVRQVLRRDLTSLLRSQ